MTNQNQATRSDEVTKAGCGSCPYVTGGATERDCAYPDCMPVPTNSVEESVSVQSDGVMNGSTSAEMPMHTAHPPGEQDVTARRDGNE